MNIIETLEQEEIARLGKTIPEFAPGDTVIVNVNVVEGERKRVQAYEGVVIAKRNRGLNSSFVVRKISSGEGVERTFQTYSPLIASIEVKRKGDVRRAKLYYLRERSGKSARIREKLTARNRKGARPSSAADPAPRTAAARAARSDGGPRAPPLLLRAACVTRAPARRLALVDLGAELDPATPDRWHIRAVGRRHAGLCARRVAVAYSCADPQTLRMKATLYEALGIPPTASDEEVRAALRRLIRKYYAKTRDGQGNVEEALRFINHASRILSDPDRRARYDHELARLGRHDRAADRARRQRRAWPRPASRPTWREAAGPGRSAPSSPTTRWTPALAADDERRARRCTIPG